MTVDSEIFMPKSKAPKMDDLDYSKYRYANASLIITHSASCKSRYFTTQLEHSCH